MGNHGHFFCEAFDMLGFFLEIAQRDEQRKITIVVTGFLETAVEIALHQLPCAIAPRLDDHTTAHAGHLGHIGGAHDLLIPLGVIFSPRGTDGVSGGLCFRAGFGLRRYHMLVLQKGALTITKDADNANNHRHGVIVPPPAGGRVRGAPKMLVPSPAKTKTHHVSPSFSLPLPQRPTTGRESTRLCRVRRFALRQKDDGRSEHRHERDGVGNTARAATLAFRHDPVHLSRDFPDRRAFRANGPGRECPASTGPRGSC